MLIIQVYEFLSLIFEIFLRYTFGKHVNGYIIFTILATSHVFYYHKMDVISRPGSDSIYVPNLEPIFNKKFEVIFFYYISKFVFYYLYTINLILVGEWKVEIFNTI